VVDHFEEAVGRPSQLELKALRKQLLTNQRLMAIAAVFLLC